MLRRSKRLSQSQPNISLPVIEDPFESKEERNGSESSNRTSIVSVETEVVSKSKEYAITDGGNSNMKVVVRVRPENEMEMQSNCETVTKILDEHVLVFDPVQDNDPMHNSCNGGGPRKRRALLSHKRKDLRFAFDRVFDENSSQTEVFEHTTKTVIDGLLDGVNCSVFAYGATGAGKTYTMLGSADNPGVMFLTTMELYRQIELMKHDKNCQVSVTYLEVYNETIRDLLSPSGPLPIREDATKGLVVSGLTRHQPTSAQDLLQMLEIGNESRTQHPTDANATSSRSHAVFQVYVQQKPRAAGLSAKVTQAKMSLIDLAGSERGTVTTNSGARFREGANINKSLLALGNCINALASNKGKTCHVPYRNSKLTRLLKDSLGGNCKTVMIANISPSSLSYEDTYNTLKYADRAKQIKTKLVRNVVNVDYHVTRYKTIVIGLQKEIEDLKSQMNISNQPTFNKKEAERLKKVISNVYKERTNLRKNMADLDAAERDTLLRVLRKERDLQRIEKLTGDIRKISRVRGKLDFLCNHLQDIKEQKTNIHLDLSKNNEDIGKTLTDINLTVASEQNDTDVLRSHIDLVLDSSKLEAENIYQWKQTKHLLKYIKNQEKDISKTEKILMQCLDLVSKQQQILHAANCMTPIVCDLYDGLVRVIEGDKEVGWSDHRTTQHNDSLHDVSFAPSHQALLDTIIAHNSPLRRPGDDRSSRYSSPINAASLGLLTASSSNVKNSTKNSGMMLKSPFISSSHPLSTRLVAAIGDRSPSASSRQQHETYVVTPYVVNKALPFRSDANTGGLASSSNTMPLCSLENEWKTHDTSGRRASTSQSSPLIMQHRHNQSPMTSPKLRKKNTTFDSPPPTIQESTDENEIDFVDSRKQLCVGPSEQLVSSSAVTNTTGDDVFVSEGPLGFSRIKQERKVKFVMKENGGSRRKDSCENGSSLGGRLKARTSLAKGKDTKVKSPKNYNSPPTKHSVNLAELTSIAQSSSVNVTMNDKPITVNKTPVGPALSQPPPVINAFDDDFVSSYPGSIKPKPIHHTPVGKSLSVDNPTYGSLPPPPPLPPSITCSPSSSSYTFQPIPNQHPAFPPPLPKRSYTPIGASSPVPASPSAPSKNPPAFLPVAKPAPPMREYRSPVNIPVHTLSSSPAPPIPSPSSISRSRPSLKSSGSSSCSQLSDSLNQQPTESGTTFEVTKTTRSHRYSLTSPTQAFKDNSFKDGSYNDALNSTFTISMSTKERRKYAVLEPMTGSVFEPKLFTESKKISHNLVKPLGVLQQQMDSSSSNESSTSSYDKPQPHYLSLTKSAAFKKVHRVAHQMNKNQKENCAVSNTGKFKSQSVKIKPKPFVNRPVSNRSQSVTVQS